MVNCSPRDHASPEHCSDSNDGLTNNESPVVDDRTGDGESQYQWCCHHGLVQSDGQQEGCHGDLYHWSVLCHQRCSQLSAMFEFSGQK